MRINKYIASAGVCSRRKADDLIGQGKVTVNGAVLSHPGYDVQPEDTVEVDGRRIEPEEKKVYYLLNKPTGVITSVNDEEGRITVLDLMEGIDVRVFPVGRLDYNTSGLLFMTNDGDFAYRLTHPKHNIGKTYLVRIAGSISRGKVERLRKGIDIGGFVTSPAEVEVTEWRKRSTQLQITIHEGKNRQIRRMFEAVGCPVQELERIAYGNVKLGHLKQGRFRKLNPSEVDYLMHRA